MKIRQAVFAPIAGTFLAGYIMVGCSPAQCTYTNAITHQQFTAACSSNSPGGGPGDNNDNDDDNDDNGEFR
jgi:hypothetical protein